MASGGVVDQAQSDHGVCVARAKSEHLLEQQLSIGELSPRKQLLGLGKKLGVAGHILNLRTGNTRHATSNDRRFLHFARRPHSPSMARLASAHASLIAV